MTLNQNELALCTVPLGHVPFLDLLAAASEAGFSALSMMPAQLEALERSGVTAADLRLRLADLGLRICEFECVAHWLPGQIEAADRVAGYGAGMLEMTPERVIPMAAAVGARSVSVAEIFNIPVDIDVAAERFAAICDRAADFGLNVNIEFLPAGGIRDVATTAEIVRRSGRANGGITLDTLHFYRGGSTLESLRALPGDMIGMVQLADAVAAAPDDIEQEMITSRLLPGQGDLDLRTIVETLDAIGTTAPIGVEVFCEANLRDPIEQTTRSWMAALRATLGRA